MNHEERATFLINKLSNNCCNVCSCEGGIKIWCACHRKQIIETIKQIEKETAEKIRRLIFDIQGESRADTAEDLREELDEAISKHFGLEDK